MWDEIFNLAISNGIFAVLFLIMLIYELKDSSVREKKYQATIDKLASSYSELKSLKEQVDDMSTDVEEIKLDIREVVNYVTPQKTKRVRKSTKNEKAVDNSPKSTIILSKNTTNNVALQ